MLEQNTHWGLPFVAERVPASLRPFPRFVTWAAAFSKPGKVDKHPRQAKEPAAGASTNKPWHWADFATACAAVEVNGFLCGLGYVLTHGETATLPGLFAIDLDHCIDDDGRLAPHAEALVEAFRTTYWERSPSGRGLRAFALGELPGGIVNHEAGVEVYDGRTARYVTITGQHLEGTARDVGAVDPFAIANLFETYGEPGQATTTTVYADMPEVLEHAQAAELTAEACEVLPERLASFLRDGVVDGYPSRSEALYACLVALYGAGWEDAETFSAMHGSPHVWQMALEHRSQKEAKAFAFIWRECCRARTRVAPGAEAFDVLDEPPAVAATTIATEPSLVWGETPSLKTREGEPSSPEFSPVVWGTTSPPPRDWIVEGYLPRGEVTIFTGDGGTGKSLLMQQLQACMAVGSPWLGLKTTPGTSLALYCEDSGEELHRRQEAINRYLLAANAELERMLLWPRPSTAGSLLMTFDNRDQGTKTKFLGHLVQRLQIRKPDVLILDTLADFYGGNENARSQVTQFCRMLSAIAARFHCAIVLCGHPSQSGNNSGSGMAGSTAWNNAVRSRLFLSREKTVEGIELNANVRLLSRMKANYSGTGDKVRLCWAEGVFRHEHEAQSETFFDSADEEAEKLFLELLNEFDNAGRRVSASKKGVYAPREFAKRAGGGADAEKRWAARFEAAMQSLIEAGRVLQVSVRAGHSSQLVRGTE